MPVGISSAARNLFLLGSSGADVVTNFFKAIDQSASPDDQFVAKGIQYSEYDEKFILGLQAEDGNSKKHGLVEKRDADGVTDWDFEIESTTTTADDTILTDIHLDVNGNLLVSGSAGNVPFVSKYSSAGVLDWQSTTNTADVRYNSVTSDSNGKYYACGNTDETNGAAAAFIEKYDAFGTPGWGKGAFIVGSDVVLHAIDCNSRGHVVAGGYLQDENNDFKGYFVKLDTTSGQVMWDRTLEITDRNWGTIAAVEINDIMIDGNDFIYIVGSQFNAVTGLSAGYICKYSPEGNMLWQKETPIGAPNSGRWRYNCVEADTATGQIIILGSYFENISDEYGVLVKYSSDGRKIFTRVLESTEASPPEFGTIAHPKGGMALDASASFYYILFTDQETDPANTIPDKYTYGKVSSSGNGLGAFSYDTGDTNTIEYYIQDLDDRIGRLSDGSVRNDTSDLATNIFNPTKIMFDDLATPVANKKRQMNSADSFQYSGSPAIRPVDLQELNLGDETITTTTTVEGGTSTGQQLFTRSPVTYSNMLTAVGTLKTPANAFSHPITNGGSGLIRSEGVGGLLFTPTNPIPYTSQVRVLDNNNVTQSWLNQTSNPGFAGTQHSNGWVTIASGSGTINSIFSQRTDSTGWDAGFCGIEVDGYLLFDGGYDLGTGNQTFTAPAGVTSVSVVCVGAGGAGGGALAYKNNITVVPGQNYDVVVGAPGYNLGGAGSNNGTSGGDSSFSAGGNTTTAEGGVTGSTTLAQPTGSFDGGGKGGYTYNGGGYSGGGAGGYDGDGGDAEIGFTNPPDANSGAGAGGDWPYNGGGGVGVLGQGTTGSSGSGGGGGGSGGTDGIVTGTNGAASVTGGTYGGGFTGRYEGNQGGPGAVRVIWGDGRAFPSTLTADQTPSSGGTTTTTITKVIDKSGKGNNGITEGATLNAAGYWEFDGVNDKINVNDLRVEELGETFTVEAWIYPTDFNPPGATSDAYPRRIMSTHRSNASTKWCLGIDTSGRVGFGGSQGVEEPDDKKYQLSLNTYHHVMLVHDDTEYTLYVDGIERANNTSSPIALANSTQDPFLCIGGRPNQGDRVYAGRIGEVRAYLRPLTAAQVFQNYNATKGEYLNEAPNTAPKIGPGIVYGSDLLLNYDFGNRATFDSKAGSLTRPFDAVDDDLSEDFLVGPSNNDHYGTHVRLTDSGKMLVAAVYNYAEPAYVYDFTDGSEITWSNPQDHLYSADYISVGSGRVAIAAVDTSSGVFADYEQKIFVYDEDLSNEVIINNGKNMGTSGPHRIYDGKLYAAARDDNNIPLIKVYDVYTGTKLDEFSITGYTNNGFGSMAIALDKIAVGIGNFQNKDVVLMDLDGSNQLDVTPAGLNTSNSDFGKYEGSLDIGIGPDGVGKLYAGDPEYNNNAGRVYSFTLDGTASTIIEAPNSEKRFGQSVAVNDGTLVVGSPNNESWIGSEPGFGNAYVVDSSGSANLTPSVNGADGNEYGCSVDIRKNRVVVGARNYGQFNIGAVYAYKKGFPAPTKVRNLSTGSANGTINGAEFDTDGYFVFDGNNDRIQIDPVVSLSTTNGFTVCTWLKVTGLQSSTTWNYFIKDADGSNPVFEIGIYNNNNYSFGFKDNSVGVNVSTVLTQNQWHLICFGVNSSAGLPFVYKDGIYAGGSSTAFGSGNFPIAHIMGPGGNNLAGQCGEVQAYNRELSGAEVLAHFNATRSKYGV